MLNSRLESVVFLQIYCYSDGMPSKELINMEMNVIRRLRAEEVAIFYSPSEMTPFRPSWLRSCSKSATKAIAMGPFYYYDEESRFPTWLELCGTHFERISVQERWCPPSLLSMFDKLPESLQCLEMRGFNAPECRFPKCLNLLDLELSVTTADDLFAWTSTTLSALASLHTLRLNLKPIEGPTAIYYDLSPYSSLSSIAIRINWPRINQQCWHIISPHLAYVEVAKMSSRGSFNYLPSPAVQPLVVLHTPNIKELYLIGIPFLPSIWHETHAAAQKSLQKLKLRHSFVCASIANSWPPSLASIILIDTDIGEQRMRSSNGQKHFTLNYSLLPPLLVELKIERHNHRDNSSRLLLGEHEWDDRINRIPSQNDDRYSNSLGGGAGPYRMDEESCAYRVLPCPKLRTIVLTDEARGAAFFPTALRCLPSSVTFIKAIASSFIYAGSVWTDDTLRNAIRGSQTYRAAVLAGAPPGTVLEDTVPILAVEKLVQICWERRTSGNPAFQLVNSAQFDDDFSALNLNSLVAYSLMEPLWKGLTEQQVQEAYLGIRTAINRGKWTTPAWNFVTLIPPSVSKIRSHGCFNPDNDGIYMDSGYIVSVEATHLENDLDLSLIPFQCAPHELPYHKGTDDHVSKNSCSMSSIQNWRENVKVGSQVDRSSSAFSGSQPLAMSYEFFGIRSIEIWESIATQIVVLNMERMDKTDIRSLLRKTRGFRLLTSLRRLRVQAGCGGCDLSLAQLPEWLEEVVWDAGSTEIGNLGFDPSLSLLLRSHHIKVPTAGSEACLRILGRRPLLWTDENRKLNLERLVCRVSHAGAFSVEELVKWRLPRLRELQLLPLKRIIGDTRKCPSNLLDDLVQHLELLEMANAANLEQIYQPRSEEEVRMIAKKFLERNASSSTLREPAIAFNVDDHREFLLNIQPELSIESLKKWLQTNIIYTSFDSFAVPNLRFFAIHENVHSINLISPEDPFLSLLDDRLDDAGRQRYFELHTQSLPVISIRQSPIDSLVVHPWPPGLTKLQIDISAQNQQFFLSLPPTLKIIHLLGTTNLREDVSPLALHQRFPNLVDLFAPSLELCRVKTLQELPQSVWRMVCAAEMPECPQFDGQNPEFVGVYYDQTFGPIPSHIRILQLNGHIIRKDIPFNFKKRKGSEDLPSVERRRSSGNPESPRESKKRLLITSSEVDDKQSLATLCTM